MFFITGDKLKIGAEKEADELKLHFIKATGPLFTWILGLKSVEILQDQAHLAMFGARTQFYAISSDGISFLKVMMVRRGDDVFVDIEAATDEETFSVEDALFTVEIWSGFVEYLRTAFDLPQSFNLDEDVWAEVLKDLNF